MEFRTLFFWETRPLLFVTVNIEVSMPLINFGSILGFAEEMEKQNMTFFSQVVSNPACDQYHALFVQLEKGAKKRVSEVQRIRRENVTEMVLEAIEEFYRDAFVVTAGDGLTMDPVIAVGKTRELMARTVEYYTIAAGKLKGQADVSRSLKNLAKKVGKEQRLLSGLTD